MAQIMTTMAAKTPNEMLETAIFLLYLFFLRYFLKKKKLPLFEKTIERKFMEIERQREEAENIGKQWC
jgi:F0F1-type ATP synthase membrane subunit b/b'